MRVHGNAITQAQRSLRELIEVAPTAVPSQSHPSDPSESMQGTQVGLELISILTSITTSPYKGSGLVYRVICRRCRA